MSLDLILEAFKKYGVTAVLALWILRQESRLNMVEDKLYNCYATMNLLNAHNRKTVKAKFETYAILPNGVDVKRDIKRYA